MIAHAISGLMEFVVQFEELGIIVAYRELVSLIELLELNSYILRVMSETEQALPC